MSKKGFGPGGQYKKTTWEGMDHDKRRRARYRYWYQQNKEERNAARRARYAEDQKHRSSILEAARSRRPEERKSKARGKFEDLVIENRDKVGNLDLTTARRGRKGHPRYAKLSNGWVGWVHSTRTLALMVGRRPCTIARWVDAGVLPGSTARFGRRYFFSKKFMQAVRRACKRLFYEDGNGSRDLLSQLIREELTRDGLSWLPPGSSEFDRVCPAQVGGSVGE